MNNFFISQPKHYDVGTHKNRLNDYSLVHSKHMLRQNETVLLSMGRKIFTILCSNIFCV